MAESATTAQPSGTTPEQAPAAASGPVPGTAEAGCGAPAAQLDAGAREFLKALASEQRQQMLELFAGGVELTVGAVAERLGVGQSNASQQLALLRRGGLLTSRKAGKQVYYRIDAAAVDRLLSQRQAYLRTCCPPPAP